MLRRSRFSTALLLTAIYTLIVMSPLAPLALKSPHLAHAISGDCTGDCDTCGCSATQRASRTCCCWREKLRQQRARERQQAPACCRTTPPAEQESDDDGIPACCRKKAPRQTTEITDGCPCGSKRQLSLPGAGNSEQLPWRFTAGILGSYEDVRFDIHTDRPTVRFGDPPDPPPKLFFFV